MERELTGRCGRCAFFVVLDTAEDGASTGECRLGCWPSPLKDTATCSSHKPIGTPWLAKPSRNSSRRSAAPRTELQARAPLPQEIDLDMDQQEFRTVLREILLEELGLKDVPIADRWRGGEVVLVPGKEGTQEKRISIDQLFHKIVLIRDKLRVLEQKINAHAQLQADEKVQMQQYVTACYGSLTTFNLLFREREDGFTGQKGKDD